MFDKQSVLFWPVGTGDSTTFVIEPDAVILQVDLRHTARAEDEETESAPIVDQMVEHLPQVNGRPYLAAFALTHPDKDHVQGFAELLNSVDIGELWFTPRIFREQKDGLCEDAVVFRTEAHRRVNATITAGGDPGSGDRVRLIGYDPLLEEEHYRGFPAEFFTVPGNAITTIDGVDHDGMFRAFVHGPFMADQLEGDRNDTSLVMQVVLGPDVGQGGVLMFGDHKYPTLRKIIDVSRANGNEDKLHWSVLLAPHHCSKSAMYQDEDGETVLKQDILDDLEALQVGDGVVVASSCSVPKSNASGDNPPHALAKARYQEIARGGFLNTADDGGHAEPLRFDLVNSKLEHTGEVAEGSAGALSGAVAAARGSDDTPTDKVGFGS